MFADVHIDNGTVKALIRFGQLKEVAGNLRSLILVATGFLLSSFGYCGAASNVRSKLANHMT